MNKSKDPFEAAYEDQGETPPQSPITDSQHPDAIEDAATTAVAPEDDDATATNEPIHSTAGPSTTAASVLPEDSVRYKGKSTKEDEDDEDDDNMEVELSKLPSKADPNKLTKMQAILSQFTEDQMNRYESFRRSALQKSNMRRLLVSVTGSQKISLPMTIVVCGIAKMFVGELVETARIVMTERNDSGPIRPCHIREAYRRLKLEGKVPKRSVPRLFR